MLKSLGAAIWFPYNTFSVHASSINQIAKLLARIRVLAILDEKETVYV
jgi:hypothetical protein